MNVTGLKLVLLPLFPNKLPRQKVEKVRFELKRWNFAEYTMVEMEEHSNMKEQCVQWMRNYPALYSRQIPMTYSPMCPVSLSYSQI